MKYPVKNMVSTAAIEQFRDHNYAVVRTTAYQTDNPATTPYIAPHAWYNYQSDPGVWNESWNLDANFLSLGRRLDTPGQNARHMQRLSLNGGWRLPYVSAGGHAWTFQMALRGDTYVFEHYQPVLTKPTLRSAFRGRLFPTASAQWRYPLVKRLDKADWVLEPTAMIVGTPRVNNNSIPNEDSLNIQVESTDSLFLRLTILAWIVLIREDGSFMEQIPHGFSLKNGLFSLLRTKPPAGSSSSFTKICR